MALKSRLLTTAFIVPLSVSLALAPARGFYINETGDSPRTSPVDTSGTTGQLNDGGHELASDGEIVIDGTPQSNNEAAVLINSAGQDVLIDGDITIRDRDDDGELTGNALENAIGIKLEADLPANISLRIGSTAAIRINEVRGPDYDGDEDGLPDANDEDEDGIIEGSSALGTDTHTRIGLWIDDTTNPSNNNIEDIIGELNSSIMIDGNGARGAQIDRALSGNFDFSTAVHNGQLGGILGDDAVGVEVNADIDGYYRQRGDIDVRGEDSVGIEIDSSATVDGGMMIDSHINATGYSLIVSGTTGGPDHGRDETELDADDVAANTAERRRSGAAVDIAGDLDGGLIIGGRVDRVLTQAERGRAESIIEQNTDDDGGRIDISGGTVRSTPVDFDANRATNSAALLSSYGEGANDATLKITGDVGLGDGTDVGSIETLLDLLDDDAQVDSDGDSDPDIYTRGTVGLKQFYFSHGLVNRGSIEANGLYDGFKADAVLIDGSSTIYGGIYNSGTISALAFNENATAIEFDNTTLTDGLRADGSVFLNDNRISASISTHAGADDSLEDDDHTATAILLTSNTAFSTTGDARFINRGTIAAAAAYFDADGDRSVGKNAIALDAGNLGADFDFTQEMPKDDELLGLGASATVNSAANPYRGGGDTDIDSHGATNDDDDDIGDNVIDTRDVNAPRIVGDIKFGAGENDFAIKAGTVSGNISFGDGDDSLTLSNEIADDEADDYTAPITTFTGRITNSADTLDIAVGDRTRLNFIGQEGDEDTDTEGLSLGDLTVSGSGELTFTIDPNQLDDELLSVTALTLSDDAKLTPSLIGLISVEDENGQRNEETVELIDYVSITKSNDIADYLADDTPFIYDVSLTDEDTVIAAKFSIKDADVLGLNKNEAAALNAVVEHFRKDDNRERSLTRPDNGEDFHEAYSELFPHYSDGTAQQLAVLSEAATGAVSQHLQIVQAGGRRDGDGWLQQFGDFRKQDSSVDNGTVSGTSYGIAFGYDFPVGPIEAMGVYTQMNFTAVNEKTTSFNEVKSDGASFGAYIADQFGPLRAEINAAFGSHDLESTRTVNFDGLIDQMRGNWEATSTSAAARLTYPILQDTHLLRLEAGVDYFNLTHDNYAETGLTNGGGFSMRLRDGESEKLTRFIGLRGAYQRGGGDPVAIVWEPNYYLGYRTVSDETPYTAIANFVGTDESFTLENFVETEDAVNLGFGLAAHNDYFAFEFNYRARIADNEETHGGGISIRLLF